MLLKQKIVETLSIGFCFCPKKVVFSGHDGRKTVVGHTIVRLHHAVPQDCFLRHYDGVRLGMYFVASNFFPGLSVIIKIITLTYVALMSKWLSFQRIPLNIMGAVCQKWH